MSDRVEFGWEELAEEARRNTRPHAGHFSWESDRAVAEWGVLCAFCDVLERQSIRQFESARHRGPAGDPPDCEATGPHGELIGIEITELVDPASAAAARAGMPLDARDWRQDLIPTLQSIITRKDNPPWVNGGPYDSYVLLIHTDEPWLEIDRVKAALRAHVFAPTSLITHAHLLISYDPHRKEYPLFELQLGQP